MRKLIINADDLGISKEVNQKIEECIKLGCITSSTLMANAPAFDDGVRIAKQYPQISVGVHLNLIEFSPLTNRDVFTKHGIVGNEGHFIEGAIFCITIDEELKNAVFEEWDAQITKVEQAGLIPSHCDSHQHTHTIPALCDVLCKVLDKHNINHVRLAIVPSVCLILREKKQPIKHIRNNGAVRPPKRNFISRRLRFFILKYKSIRWNHSISNVFSTTHCCYAFRHFYYDSKFLSLGNGESTIELMCHPGHKAYQDETDKLMRNKTWLPTNYKLFSYKDLR